MSETPAPECPRCNTGHDVHRSRSWVLRDLLMWLIGKRAYRCHACSERFYDERA
jgi:transposase-like protein